MAVDSTTVPHSEAQSGASSITAGDAVKDQITPSMAREGVTEKENPYGAGTHLEDGNPEELSPPHRDYLLARHGTVDLVPLPSMDPADPLNWPAWKVCYTALPHLLDASLIICRKMLTSCSFHSMQ